MIRRGVEKVRQQIARGPKNPLAGRGVLILHYHRVVEVRSDPWSLSVTPRHFAEQLEVLRQHVQPISLWRLSQGLIEGNLPDRSVVITFDDGYADNLYNAKPLLERYGVPATFFLTTGYIGHEREFWWDELERLLLQPGTTLPETLRLSVNGSMYQWELGEATYYSEDASQRYRDWRAWEDTPEGAPSSRHYLYRSLWELLNPLAEGEQRKVLDELFTWADLRPTVRPTYRSLSLEEVVALSQGERIEIGAHTVTHPALTALPVGLQRSEILESKARLEEILGRRVDGFSYPYGALSRETASIVRKAGFACACSTADELVGQATDRYRLPRIQAVDWDGEKFARQLLRWFDD